MRITEYFQIKDFIYFLRGLVQNRRAIWQLVEKDIKNQYLGSFLGITWLFIQPVTFILVLWLVLETGLRRAQASGNIPFILFLLSGMIIWFFFSSFITSGNSSIKNNRFLVTKMVFRVSMLPLVHVMSSLFISVFFLFTAIVLSISHGNFRDIYYLRLIYFVFSTIILTLGIFVLGNILFRRLKPHFADII